jgi:hypothetical protein
VNDGIKWVHVKEGKTQICRIFPNVSLFKNQEANYLLNRQITKTDKNKICGQAWDLIISPKQPLSASALIHTSAN